MTSVSKSTYTDKLEAIVNKYNNTYHSTIKMKPFDVNIDYTKEINNENPKYKIGDTVRTSKYKNIFSKRYTSNCPKEVFVIKKVKNTVPWTYGKVINYMLHWKDTIIHLIFNSWIDKKDIIFIYLFSSSLIMVIYIKCSNHNFYYNKCFL